MVSVAHRREDTIDYRRMRPNAVKRDFDRAVSKLEEAQRHLDELCDTWKDSVAQSRYSAFLTAARSSTFVLQGCLAHKPGFKSWWEAQRDLLRKDSLARFLVEARNEAEKLGVEALHAHGRVTRWSAEGPRCQRVYRFRPLDDAKVQVPPGDAMALSQQHLNRLAGLLLKAGERFKVADAAIVQRLERIAQATLPEPAVCPLHLASETVRLDVSRCESLPRSGGPQLAEVLDAIRTDDSYGQQARN